MQFRKTRYLLNTPLLPDIKYKKNADNTSGITVYRILVSPSKITSSVNELKEVTICDVIILIYNKASKRDSINFIS